MPDYCPFTTDTLNKPPCSEFTLLLKLGIFVSTKMCYANLRLFEHQRQDIFVSVAGFNRRANVPFKWSRRNAFNHTASTLIARVMRAYVLLLLVAFASNISAKNYVRVCYHTNWSQYRPGAGKFWPENIDPHLCTHLMYSFAKINRNNDKLAMYEWNDDKLYPRFNALKKKNPNLRTLLAVGGWNHENANSPFSKMVRTAASRKVLQQFLPFYIACFINKVS